MMEEEILRISFMENTYVRVFHRYLLQSAMSCEFDVSSRTHAHRAVAKGCIGATLQVYMYTASSRSCQTEYSKKLLSCFG